MTPGPVQSAIVAKIGNNHPLLTPSQGAPFIVQRVDHRGVTLLLGKKEASTPFTWAALEGAFDFLNGRGWVTIGGVYDVSSVSGTFDEYLKRHINRATAPWVAALFEAAGLVQISRDRPARVKALRDESLKSYFGAEPQDSNLANHRDVHRDRLPPKATICPKCFLTLPTSGICGSCE